MISINSFDFPPFRPIYSTSTPERKKCWWWARDDTFTISHARGFRNDGNETKKYI